MTSVTDLVSPSLPMEGHPCSIRFDVGLLSDREERVEADAERSNLRIGRRINSKSDEALACNAHLGLVRVTRGNGFQSGPVLGSEGLAVVEENIAVDLTIDADALVSLSLHVVRLRLTP